MTRAGGKRARSLLIAFLCLATVPALAADESHQGKKSAHSHTARKPATKKKVTSKSRGHAALANGAASAEHRAELQDIHGRLESLKKDLAKSEESRASVVDQLRETETAISVTNRRLRELGESRSALSEEIDQLERQSTSLGKQIESQQKQLGALLYRHYIHGEEDALKLLLSGEDPNRIAQDQYFLTQLSRAKARLLGQLKESLATKQRLADTRRDKLEQLASVEKAQQESRTALVVKQKERQGLLASIADRIKSQRKEIDVLKANEQRLTKLIETLARAPRNEPRKEDKPPPRTPGVSPGMPAERPGDKPALRNEALPEGAGGGAFAALRGKLHLPLRGEIAGRFGSPRAESGALWKGLFIRATEGTEVHAVAAGKVVFADWLRGFGNLLIVDHGGGYLSIYGNNQSLFRDAGQNVKSGETIAAAGNSGGQGESGLYFELRHQGQAFDPLKWASLR